MDNVKVSGCRQTKIVFRPQVKRISRFVAENAVERMALDRPMQKTTLGLNPTILIIQKLFDKILLTLRRINRYIVLSWQPGPETGRGLTSDVIVSAPDYCAWQMPGKREQFAAKRGSAPP